LKSPQSGRRTALLASGGGRRGGLSCIAGHVGGQLEKDDTVHRDRFVRVTAVCICRQTGSTQALFGEYRVAESKEALSEIYPLHRQHLVQPRRSLDGKALYPGA
jgi:hypothetical protein